MRRQDCENFSGKKVRLSLKNGNSYTGEILTLSDSVITFHDKYDKKVLIDLSSIASIEEYNDHHFDKDGKVV